VSRALSWLESAQSLRTDQSAILRLSRAQADTTNALADLSPGAGSDRGSCQIPRCVPRPRTGPKRGQPAPIARIPAQAL